MKPPNNHSFSLLAIFFLLIFLFVALWGLENSQMALFLIEHPIMIPYYLIRKLGYFKLITVILGSIAMALVLMLNCFSNQKRRETKQILRGAEIIPHRQLVAIFKKELRKSNLLKLEIAGIPIPHRLENLGFFMFGSPGTGKTQAISQMTATIRKRSDFRAIIFDRSGEMLEKFYDPTKDIIFNPFDVRSVGWSHAYEAARPETMAAGLIPQESEKEPFFSNAGRVVMTELFHQTQSNQELWSLLVSDTTAIKSFIAKTLAARYMGEEKSATSILSTISNYCQFYPYLDRSHNKTIKTISFYDWARKDCSSWLFITLEENDSELLKPLHTLIFELMLKGLLSNKNRKLKTAIIIDELGALNQLPSLHRLMSESRKYQGCPIFGTQTKSQITKIYGREDTSTILQGTQTKLILRCPDHETANSMADIIGKQEYIDISENQSRSRHSGRGGNGRTHGFNEQFRESYAIMPDEIKLLPNLEGYLKIDKYCTPVRLKHKKLPVVARNFVPLPDSQSIQEQWADLEEIEFLG